jgi:hypothetical protein
MGGNLLEWMADITGPNTGIVRGGSWEGHPDQNDQAYTNYPLDRTYGSLGIRCAYGQIAPPPPPPPPPPPTAKAAPIYRAYNGEDHLQGLQQGEGAPAWKSEGISFHVLKTAPAAASYQLYRCRLTNDNNRFHFLSNDAHCEGQTVDGLLGYVYAAQAANTKPIYRCRKGTGGIGIPAFHDHLSTLTPDECRKGGYQVEGTQGYALP